ncbi:hypothetical protein JCM11491_001841 [Sporobolomyces phaffii]
MATAFPLNADIVRLVIRQAADEIERSTSHSPVDAFYQRSALLRRLALVNSRWRPLAQLELESYVVLTSRNFSLVSHRLEQQDRLARRVRRLVDRRGTTREQKQLDDVLAKCEGLRELDCKNTRFSLNSLLGMKLLDTLSLSNVALAGTAEHLVLPCRLRSFTLSGTCEVTRSDWRALKGTGTSSLEHLELVGRITSDPASLVDTLSAWLPSVRSLEMADIFFSTSLIPCLNRCQRLERLAIKLLDLPAAIAVLDCSPRQLEIVASSEVLDNWTFEDYQSNVLWAVGKEPLDQVESVKVSRAPGIYDSVGSREVALLVKIGRRKQRGSIPPGKRSRA